MLSIHIGLRKWKKINVFNLHLLKSNPFDIRVPCIKIVNIEMLFEQNIMALNWGKYDIEFLNDDAIKRNRIFFDLLQRTFNRLDGLYSREGCFLVDTIMKDKLRKQSAA